MFHHLALHHAALPQGVTCETTDGRSTLGEDGALEGGRARWWGLEVAEGARTRSKHGGQPNQLFAERLDVVVIRRSEGIAVLHWEASVAWNRVGAFSCLRSPAVDPRGHAEGGFPYQCGKYTLERVGCWAPRGLEASVSFIDRVDKEVLM